MSNTIKYLECIEHKKINNCEDYIKHILYYLIKVLNFKKRI